MRCSLVKNVVIFDLDGTLVDTSAGILNSVKDTVSHFGLSPLTDSELITFMGGSIYESFKRFYPETDSVALVDYFRERYTEVHFEEAQPYEGIYGLLEKLYEDGVTVGVATFKREDLANRLLSSYTFYKHIHCICGSDSEGILKKTDIINNCLQLLNVKDKRDVLFVGDAPNDALSAKMVGVSFLGVAYGYGFKTEEEVYKLHSHGSFAERVIDIYNVIKQNYYSHES